MDANGEGHNELWDVDAASGQRTKLIAAAELIPTAGGEPIGVVSFSFSRDGRKLLLFTNAQRVWRARTKGEYYVCDLEARTLTPVSTQPGWQRRPREEGAGSSRRLPPGCSGLRARAVVFSLPVSSCLSRRAGGLA